VRFAVEGDLRPVGRPGWLQVEARVGRELRNPAAVDALDVDVVVVSVAGLLISLVGADLSAFNPVDLEIAVAVRLEDDWRVVRARNAGERLHDG